MRCNSKPQMFSSTNSLNFSPHFPSSSYQPFLPPPFPNYNPDDHQIFPHQNDPLAGPFPETLINFSVSNNNNNNHPIMTRQSINIGNPLGISNFLAKKPVKKDRHSKIYTSQGLRDRRVRLSIEIARKFFDLQDMLGFDKASKTLDWLLTKSRKAIKEVTKMKQSCNGCAKTLSPISSDCEVLSHKVTTDSGNLEGIVLSKNKNSSLVTSGSKEKNMKKLSKDEIHLLSKELRAKARARARERTREKMCTRKLHESRKCPAPGGPQMLQQQFEACEKPSKVVGEIEQPSSHQMLGDQGLRANVFEESILIRRKIKQSSGAGRLGYYQPNNESCSNYFPSSPLNWDINSTNIARSSFCAITNMNLSTGIILEQNIYIYIYIYM